MSKDRDSGSEEKEKGKGKGKERLIKLRDTGDDNEMMVAVRAEENEDKESHEEK
jgi:hypothetical protein